MRHHLAQPLPRHVVAARATVGGCTGIFMCLAMTQVARGEFATWVQACSFVTGIALFVDAMVSIASLNAQRSPHGELQGDSALYEHRLTNDDGTRAIAYVKLHSSSRARGDGSCEPDNHLQHRYTVALALAHAHLLVERTAPSTTFTALGVLAWRVVVPLVALAYAASWFFDRRVSWIKPD